MHSDLYPREYYEGGGGSNYVNYSDDPGWPVTVQVLRTFLPERSPILEVGCATGWFVHHAVLDGGFDAFGFDVSSWAVNNPAPGARDRLEECSVLNMPEDEYFGAVVSWEMLEHVPEDDVEIALWEMIRRVEPGGYMVHRIALEDAAHDHDADGDETHFTIKPREWWLERFANFPGLTRMKNLEDDFDKAFSGRDWSGRFFVYRVD